MKNERTGLETVYRIRRISYLILAVLILLFCVLLAVLGPRAYWSRFTPEKWQDHPDRRASMVDDLLEEHELAGMTEEAVAALLGDGDGGPEAPGGKDRLAYRLGEDGPSGGGWLLVDFANGVVTGVRTTER